MLVDLGGEKIVNLGLKLVLGYTLKLLKSDEIHPHCSLDKLAGVIVEAIHQSVITLGNSLLKECDVGVGRIVDIVIVKRIEIVVERNLPKLIDGYRIKGYTFAVLVIEESVFDIVNDKSLCRLKKLGKDVLKLLLVYIFKQLKVWIECDGQ